MNQLNKYHPIRYPKRNSFAQKALRAYLQENNKEDFVITDFYKEDEDFFVTGEEKERDLLQEKVDQYMNGWCEEIYKDYVEAVGCSVLFPELNDMSIEDMQKPEIQEKIKHSARRSDHEEIFSVWASYQLFQKRIYSFHPNLIDTFLTTDLSDFTVEDLFSFLPSEKVFYIHFGGHESDIAFSAGVSVEGVYFIDVSNEIRRTCILYAVPSAPLTQAQEPIDIAKEVEPFSKFKISCGSDEKSLLSEQIEIVSQNYREFSQEKRLNEADEVSYTNEILAEDIEEDAPPGYLGLAIDSILKSHVRPSAAEDILKVVFNSLLYLQVQQDTRMSWDGMEKSANISQLEERYFEAREKTPQKVNKLRQQLEKEGYTLVHLVGEKFVGSEWKPHQILSKGARGELTSSHIRKSHYRWQRYGEGRKLRKLVKIEEAVIRSDLGEPTGRITRVMPGKYTTEDS